jgi:hypothetical protein
MGQDSDGGDRDFVDATMARGEQSDEVITDVNDVLSIAEMGDGVNVTKM